MPKVVKKVASIKKTTSLRANAKQSQKEIAAKPSASRSDKLSVPVYSLAGRTNGTLALPREIFGKEVNKKLLAQAVRVYTTNKSSHPGKTKTRGEVEGSSVKIFRQKGTGRARHGSVRAPIFVGGGIVFGPTARTVRLTMPQKMKKAALFSALSSKAAEKEILGVSGIDKATGKTKEIADLLKKMNTKNVLILVVEKQDSIIRAVKNIPQTTTLPVNQVNAYEVLKHKMLILTKEAVERLAK